MHITSGLSPTSGELYVTAGATSYENDIYGISYESVNDSDVPESSHTVEIEYVSNDQRDIVTFYEECKTEIENIDQDFFKDGNTGLITNDQPNEKKYAKDFSCKPNEKKRTREDSPERSDDGLTDYTQSESKDNTHEDTDPELTNLTWLQNITNIMSISAFPISPVSPTPQNKGTSQNTRLLKFNQTIAKCEIDFTEKREEYKNQEALKPPYSYSTLICMAMRYNNNKVTLSTIYSWIKENFKYYKVADPTWKNSIRHNLSLNKIFVKSPRSKQEPGKGGFWKLDLDRLEENKNQPQKKKKVSKETEKKEDPTPGLVDPPITFEDFSTPTIQPFSSFQQSGTVSANVIVEPVEPPSSVQVDDLNTIFLNSNEWDDMQIDILDPYLDSCFIIPELC